MTVGLGLPGVGAPVAADAPVRAEAGGVTLHVLDVGLACCAMEYVAATLDGSLRQQGVEPYAGLARAQVLVVSGTVTDRTAEAVRRLYDQLPEPRRVVSFGSCANSGGPYWDSYCVTKGVDTVVPVDLYVPGCPPRPEALVDALARLAETAG